MQSETKFEIWGVPRQVKVGKGRTKEFQYLVDRKQQDPGNLQLFQGMSSNDFAFYTVQLLDKDLSSGNKRDVEVRDHILDDGWIQCDVDGVKILLKPVDIDTLDPERLRGKLIVRRHTPDYIERSISPFEVRKPSEDFRKTAHFGCLDGSTMEQSNEHGEQSANKMLAELVSVKENPSASPFASKKEKRRVATVAKRKGVMGPTRATQPKTVQVRKPRSGVQTQLQFGTVERKVQSQR